MESILIERFHAYGERFIYNLVIVAFTVYSTNLTMLPVQLRANL